MNNKNYIDENVVRIIAFQVVLLVILALYFQWPFIMLFLVFDFALRAFTNKPSPLAFLAKNVVKLLQLKSKYIFSGPKKFAASLGVVFTLSILILQLTELYFMGWVIGISLISCAILESVFKVCIGCYVYNWFVAPIVNSKNASGK